MTAFSAVAVVRLDVLRLLSLSGVDTLPRRGHRARHRLRPGSLSVRRKARSLRRGPRSRRRGARSRRRHRLEADGAWRRHRLEAGSPRLGRNRSERRISRLGARGIRRLNWSRGEPRARGGGNGLDAGNHKASASGSEVHALRAKAAFSEEVEAAHSHALLHEAVGNNDNAAVILTGGAERTIRLVNARIHPSGRRGEARHVRRSALIRVSGVGSARLRGRGRRRLDLAERHSLAELITAFGEFSGKDAHLLFFLFVGEVRLPNYTLRTKDSYVFSQISLGACRGY